MEPRQDLHLLEWLRRIRLSWELENGQLARIAHVPVEVIEALLQTGPEALEELPTVPAGLEPAVPLVGLYRQLEIVYPTAVEQNRWLQEPNPIFEGHRPIDVMAMSPSHLAYVAYTVETGLRLGPSGRHSE